MFKRIMVGFDESDGSRDALVLGRQIADRLNADLVLVGVVPPPTGGSLIPALPANAFTNLVAQAEAGLALVAEEFDATTEIIESSSAARGLAELVEDLEGDLLILGCAGPESGKVRAGHKARVLMQGSPCAVAIAPVNYRHNPGNLSKVGAAVVGEAIVGAAVDGSPESFRALETAVEIAGTSHSVRVISVTSDFSEAWGFWGASLVLAELGDASRKLAREVLEKAMALVPDGVTAETVMLEGAAAAQLQQQSASGLDMLCVGSRSYGPIRRVLLGSVSAQLVHDAGCPILVLPRH